MNLAQITVRTQAERAAPLRGALSCLPGGNRPLAGFPLGSPFLASLPYGPRGSAKGSPTRCVQRPFCARIRLCFNSLHCLF